VLSATTL